MSDIASVEAITSFERFLSLEEEWGKLLAASASRNVALTFDWFSAWWKGFGGDKELRVLRVSDAQGVLGIAPLMKVRGTYRGLPVSEVRFMENEHSPSCEFIIRREPQLFAKTVIAYLEESEKGWHQVRLQNIPKESLTFGALSAALEGKRGLHGIAEGLRSPYITINGTWEQFLNGRSKKFRKTLRNKMNRKDKETHCEITRVEESARHEELLAMMYRISEKSWKGSVNQELSASEENKAFFGELTKAARRNKWLRVWQLAIEGEPVAYEYHLCYGGSIYALRSDYDEHYRLHSPGSLLDMHVVENAFSSPGGKEGAKADGSAWEEYNMCGSSDFYKLNWTSTIREHARVIFYGRSLYSRLLHAGEFVLLPWARKLPFYERLRVYK